MVEPGFGELHDRVKSLIRTGNNFLVVAHVDPDGDCVGSMLALAAFLRNLGKEVDFFIPGDIPEKYSKIPGMERILTGDLVEPAGYDAIFSVDVPTLERAGNIFKPGEAGDIINIDHHPTNTRFGTVNLVRDGASSTAVLVYHLLSAYGDDAITKEIADCLYLGIIMDTGCFRFSNTDSESLEVASRLLARGARGSEIAREFYHMRSPSAVKLLGLVLNRLKFYGDGRIAVMELTSSMLDECGGRIEDTEGFIDFGTAIEGVELVAFLREMEPGKVRVSLRSLNRHDVSSLAEEYGGGGHTNAAGLMIDDDLQNAHRLITDSLQAMLDEAG
ncbi:MAG: bifunctional oligoribonuclease/PAP phosphatase NrnA [Candidatus Krumholzibacteriales bacterium]